MSAPTTAADRLISADLLAEELEPAEAASAQLRIAETELGVELERGMGLWEAGPGSDTDTEIDEIFLVLSGAGTVTFADGSAIDLRPGVLVRLRAGDRTTWDITDRLRKLYLA